jgi:hypothetical protein
MTDLDEQLRRTLRDLAHEGRPVNLGRAALAGARQRRRTHFGVAAVAVLVAAAIAVPAVLMEGSGARLPAAPEATGEPAGPPAATDPTGEMVISSYFDGHRSHQLNPATGEYRPGSLFLSPDLRHGTDQHEAAAMQVRSTVGGDRRTVIWPVPAWGLAWSPDSTRMAGLVFVRQAGYVGDDDARELRERFREVAVVEIASGDGWQVPLELPADRDGVRLFWLDDDHLAVAVADPNAPVVRAPRGSVTFPDGSILTIGGGASPLIDEVLIYQAGGGLAGRVAVDQQDYLASGDPRLLWDVEQATRDGMLVLRRQPDGTTIELAAVDPGDGAVAATVRLELPPAPAGHYWLPAGPYELTAVVDRQVLVGVALALEPTNPDFQQRQDPVAHDYYLADLAAGSARLANLPPLPDDAWWLSFTHADGLPPASAEHAFRP